MRDDSPKNQMNHPVTRPLDVRALAQRLLNAAAEQRQGRQIVALAGIGGAGKSTLARAVVNAADAQQRGVVKLLPMDGFHFTNEELERKNLRHMKGAPQTFDLDAFERVLRAAREGQERVAFPVYDRTLHEPVWRDAPQQIISPQTRLVLVEGNYLLLANGPWARLADCFDETWLLQTPVEVARQWIIDRHVRGGKSRDEAQAHYDCVDGPNAQQILRDMREPDLKLELILEEGAERIDQ